MNTFAQCFMAEDKLISKIPSLPSGIRIVGDGNLKNTSFEKVTDWEFYGSMNVVLLNLPNFNSMECQALNFGCILLERVFEIHWIRNGCPREPCFDPLKVTEWVFSGQAKVVLLNLPDLAPEIWIHSVSFSPFEISWFKNCPTEQRFC